MSHRFIGVTMAWAIVTLTVIGGVAALVMELELGLGPTEDLLLGPTYNRVFTLHGAAMGLGALRIGLFAPVANLYIAQRREVSSHTGRASVWLAALGSLAYLVGAMAILGIAALMADNPELSIELIAGFGAVLAVGDVCLGSGVFAGMLGTRRIDPAAPQAPRVTLLGIAVVLAAMIILLHGATSLAGRSPHPLLFGPGLMRVPHVLFVALLLTASQTERVDSGTRIGFAAVVALGLSGIVAQFGALLDGQLLLTGLSGWLAGAGQLGALGAMLASLRPNPNPTSIPLPSRDYAPASVLAYALLILVALYVATLSVDVHIRDSYIVVAEFHLMMLVSLALGGPIALRHFGPHRYVHTASWARRLAPWLIGIATIIFCVTLLTLGHAGMPRRYYAYLPEFLTAHRCAAAAAYFLCAGVLVEATLWLRPSPKQSLPLPQHLRNP